MHWLSLCCLRSPWVKILERPGDDHGNRSEEVHIENPYKNKDSNDVSADVPEKVRWGGSVLGWLHVMHAARFLVAMHTAQRYTDMHVCAQRLG
jgi:hypothetical protein